MFMRSLPSQFTSVGTGVGVAVRVLQVAVLLLLWSELLFLGAQ